MSFYFISNNNPNAALYKKCVVVSEPVIIWCIERACKNSQQNLNYFLTNAEGTSPNFEILNNDIFKYWSTYVNKNVP